MNQRASRRRSPSGAVPSPGADARPDAVPDASASPAPDADASDVDLRGAEAALPVAAVGDEVVLPPDAARHEPSAPSHPESTADGEHPAAFDLLPARTRARVIVLVGVLVLALIGFGIWRAASRSTTAAPTAGSGKANYCLLLADAEMYSPPMLDSLVLHASASADLSTRLLGIVNAYYTLRTNPLSDEIAEQLATMISLTSEWKTQADWAGLASTQNLYHDERQTYVVAYDALDAFSKTTCPA